MNNSDNYRRWTKDHKVWPPITPTKKQKQKKIQVKRILLTTWCTIIAGFCKWWKNKMAASHGSSVCTCPPPFCVSNSGLMWTVTFAKPSSAPPPHHPKGQVHPLTHKNDLSIISARLKQAAALKRRTNQFHCNNATFYNNKAASHCFHTRTVTIHCCVKVLMKAQANSACFQLDPSLFWRTFTEQCCPELFVNCLLHIWRCRRDVLCRCDRQEDKKKKKRRQLRAVMRSTLPNESSQLI